MFVIQPYTTGSFVGFRYRAPKRALPADCFGTTAEDLRWRARPADPKGRAQGPWKSVESTSGGNKLCCDQAHHRSTTNIVYVQLVSTNMLYTPNMGGYKTNHWDCLKMSHTQMIPFMYVEFYWLKSFDVPLDVFNPSYLRVQQRQPLLWNGKDVQTSASP